MVSLMATVRSRLALIRHFLTQSTYSIAAMVCTDGIDGSYLQYLLFEKENPGLAVEYRSMNDGPPFGHGGLVPILASGLRAHSARDGG